MTPRPLSPGAGRSRAVSQGASCHVPRPGGIQGPCKGQDRGRGVVQDAHACRPRERAHVNPTPRKTEPHFTKRCVFQKPIPYIPHLKAILSFEGAASRVWSRLSMSVSFLFPDHARLKLRRPNPPPKNSVATRFLDNRAKLLARAEGAAPGGVLCLDDYMHVRPDLRTSYKVSPRAPSRPPGTNRTRVSPPPRTNRTRQHTNLRPGTSTRSRAARLRAASATIGPRSRTKRPRGACARSLSASRRSTSRHTPPLHPDSGPRKPLHIPPHPGSGPRKPLHTRPHSGGRGVLDVHVSAASCPGTRPPRAVRSASDRS